MCEECRIEDMDHQGWSSKGDWPIGGRPIALKVVRTQLVNADMISIVHDQAANGRKYSLVDGARRAFATPPSYRVHARRLPGHLCTRTRSFAHSLISAESTMPAWLKSTIAGVVPGNAYAVEGTAGHPRMCTGCTYRNGSKHTNRGTSQAGDARAKDYKTSACLSEREGNAALVTPGDCTHLQTC
ncbi:hypothetical protein C8Q74DRAFT_1436462 [Fomes fomentarius]|nr:hypothetical protein C8Q74DRAFT_1436462 [Fomes fomentarius]